MTNPPGYEEFDHIRFRESHGAGAQSRLARRSEIVPLSQNTALFSLLGTTYGGEGKSNFALPNPQGSAPMHPGQGPGLSLHDPGETGGSETVTLLESEIPSHPHSIAASQADGTERAPLGQLFATGIGVSAYASQGPLTQLNPGAITPAGGDAPHDNMMPCLTFYFCIALQGEFPRG